MTWPARTGLCYFACLPTCVPGHSTGYTDFTQGTRRVQRTCSNISNGSPDQPDSGENTQHTHTGTNVQDRVDSLFSIRYLLSLLLFPLLLLLSLLLQLPFTCQGYFYQKNVDVDDISSYARISNIGQQFSYLLCRACSRVQRINQKSEKPICVDLTEYK